MHAAGNIAVYDATNPANRSRLIVLTSGYRVKASLEWAVHMPWLRQYASVMILDHPKRGFSFDDEAKWLAECIKSFSPTELYLVPVCMSLHVGRRVIRLLRGTSTFQTLRGQVIACGFTDSSVFIGGSPWVLRLTVWLFTSKWFKRIATRRVQRKNPDLETTEMERPEVTAWRQYDDTLPYWTKVRQAWAGANCPPPTLGEWEDVPTIQICVEGDRIIRSRPAADAVARANSSTETVWIERGGSQHCAMPKYPEAWARALTEAFGRLGLELDPTHIIDETAQRS